jgi:predicted nucleic acid binding AN1-type Zn finger protein
LDPALSSPFPFPFTLASFPFLIYTSSADRLSKTTSSFNTAFIALTTPSSLPHQLDTAVLNLVVSGIAATSSTITQNHRYFNSTTTATMPAKKIRCTFKECTGAAQRIVGDCAFCNGHYCGKHRLLEDHKCEGLEDVSSVPEPEWWSVGLFGLTAGEDSSLADILSLPQYSARRKRTRRTLSTSSRRGRRLSRASRMKTVTAAPHPSPISTSIPQPEAPGEIITA